MRTEYDVKDLLAIRNGETTIDKVASKYGVSRNAIIHALKYRKIKVRQKKILIKSPYGEKVCKSITEASKELQLSRNTIRKALLYGSDTIRVLKDLELEVKRVY